jgi:hypothetical protein
LTLGLAFGLLQPIKGAIVALQWSQRMHGFDLRANTPPRSRRAGANQGVNES